MTAVSYDFWLFDLDGTIVDVEWSYIRSQFDRVGDALDRPFTDWESEVLWYGFGGDRERTLDRLGIDSTAFWSTFDGLENPTDRIDATFVYPDVDSLLTEIDSPVGVVTHCPDPLTEPVLDHLELADRFDTVVCCSDHLGWKPDPGPVRHAITNLTVPSSASGVLVGDGASDIGAAWNAGIDGIHIDRHGPDRRGDCVLGDKRIRSFDELVLRHVSPAAD